MREEHRRRLIETIRAASKPLEPAPTGITPVLMPLEGIRAVLFDVYGTLFISASGDVGVAAAQDRPKAMADALIETGLLLSADAASGKTGEAAAEIYLDAIRADHARKREAGIEHPEVEIRAIWRGMSARLDERGLRKDSESGGAPGVETIERLAVAYECRVNPVWPMPGATETLAALRDRGFVLGIVSNAQFFTPLLFPALMGAEVFELGFAPGNIVFSYLCGEAKPSRALFEKALASLSERHDIKPSQVLYIGNDMRNDVQPACETGFRTALFAGDKRSLRLREDEPRRPDLKPDLILSELLSLLPCLRV